MHNPHPFLTHLARFRNPPNVDNVAIVGHLLPLSPTDSLRYHRFVLHPHFIRSPYPRLPLLLVSRQHSFFEFMSHCTASTPSATTANNPGNPFAYFPSFARMEVWLARCHSGDGVFRSRIRMLSRGSPPRNRNSCPSGRSQLSLCSRARERGKEEEKEKERVSTLGRWG